MSSMVSDPIRVFSSEPFKENSHSWTNNLSHIKNMTLAEFPSFLFKAGKVLSVPDVDLGEIDPLVKYFKSIKQFEDISENNLSQYPSTGGINSWFWYYKQKLAPFFALLDIFTSLNIVMDGQQQWYSIPLSFLDQVNQLAAKEHNCDPLLLWNSFFSIIERIGRSPNTCCWWNSRSWGFGYYTNQLYALWLSTGKYELHFISNCQSSVH